MTAARLMPEMRLYSDFAFLQAPLLPIANAVLFTLTDYKHLLLAARLHAMFWGIITLGGVYGIAFVFSRRNRLVASAGTLALASQRLFLDGVAESSNYAMPLGLTVVCFFLTALAVSNRFDPKQSRFLVIGSGLTLGLAISCKSFYLVFVAGIAAMILLTSAIRLLVPWVLGLFIGIFPAVFFFALDPGAFYFGNLQYHLSNTAYRRATGWPGPMNLVAKLGYTYRLWREPLPLLATAYSAAGAAFLWFGREQEKFSRVMFLAAWLMLVLALTAALLPTPSFDQYFALPVAFVVVASLAAVGLATLPWQFVLVLIFGGTLAAAPATRELANKADATVPSRLRLEARRFGSDAACSSETYVATLAPMLPLEAGCRVYPELATGPFAFRIADRRSEFEQIRFRIVGPRRLQSFLGAKAPHGIYVGFEPGLDKHFEKFAKQRGYTRLSSKYFDRGRVWLRSSASGPTAASDDQTVKQ